MLRVLPVNLVVLTSDVNNCVVNYFSNANIDLESLRTQHRAMPGLLTANDLMLPSFARMQVLQVTILVTKKVEVCFIIIWFYIAQYPVGWTAQTAYTSPPDRTVHAGNNSTSLGSILDTQQLRSKIIHSHFQHRFQPGTHVYC